MAGSYLHCALDHTIRHQKGGRGTTPPPLFPRPCLVALLSDVASFCGLLSHFSSCISGMSVERHETCQEHNMTAAISLGTLLLVAVHIGLVCAIQQFQFFTYSLGCGASSNCYSDTFDAASVACVLRIT